MTQPKSKRLAVQQYVDDAVAGEATRAGTAEGTKVNASTYTSGQATQDAALAGEITRATTAESAVQAAAATDATNKVATETSRATAAELALRNLSDSSFLTGLSNAFVQLKETAPTPERFGAAGNGTTDDTAALAAWAASGYTGLALHPGSVYKTSQPIAAPVSLLTVKGNGATIKASASMSWLWSTPTDTRLHRANIQGLFFDCNQLALGMKLGYASRCALRDITVLNSTGDSFVIGDAAALTSFGNKLQNLLGDRDSGVAMPVGSRGLALVNAADGMVIGAEMIGAETGIYVEGSAWQFYFPHAWGRTNTTLPVTCFDNNGWDNVWFGMYADSPTLYGFRQRLASRASIFGGRIYANALTPDNVVTGVQLDASATPLLLSGAAFVADFPASRMLTDIAGDLSAATITGTTWTANITTKAAYARAFNAWSLAGSGTSRWNRGLAFTRFTQTVSTSSATITVDTTTGNYHKVFLTSAGSVSTTTLNNSTTGQQLTLTYSQPSGGGRTYTWPTTCRFVGGSAPSDTTGNTQTSVTFIYDGSLWLEVNRAVAVPVV